MAFILAPTSSSTPTSIAFSRRNSSFANARCPSRAKAIFTVASPEGSVSWDSSKLLLDIKELSAVISGSKQAFLKGANLNVPEREVNSVTGKKGSGKSTLAKRWKVSCFRNDKLSCSEAQPDFPGEEILSEKPETSEIEKSSAPKRDVISNAAKVANFVKKVTGKRWIVPWSADTILQVMFLWVVSFWFIGSWIIPFGAHLIGYSKQSLTFRGQALFSLLTDVTEGLSGILILQRCLSKFRPFPSDFFKFNLKKEGRKKWLFDVVLGCLLFPLVNRLSQFNLNLLPVLQSTPATLSSVEQSIIARDPIAMGLYALVLVVCAPLWEEIVFRGFLLPSLTRYMPVWCSILMSSVAFALAHFNVQRMLPLIFLGMIMGVVYARSKNLLPSILLHSLWNGFVFLDLMK